MAGPEIHLGVPEVSTEHGRVVHRTPFVLDGEAREVRYEVDEQWDDLVSPLADAPLLALTPFALLHGATVRVVGPVTDELVHGLHHGALDLQRRVSPRFTPVTIVASETVTPAPPATGVATGLTGGVDSWCVIADHLLDPAVPPSSRLTHLLSNDVLLAPSRATLEAARVRLHHLADDLGLPLVVVDSNLGRLQAEQAFDPFAIITSAQVSVAFLLQRGIGTLLFATTVAERQVDGAATGNATRLDGLLLPHLANGSVRIRSVGGEYRRADKIVRIAEEPAARATLDVCFAEHQGRNCGSCPKCRRTLALLDVLGLVDHFGTVFDLDAWATARTRTLRRLQQSPHPHAAEMVEVARERGVRLPRPRPFPGLRRALRGRRPATGWSSQT